MRKTWMVLSALALTVIAGASANLHAQDVAVGVRAGLSVSDLSIDEDGTSLDTSTESGITGGVFVQIGLGEVFAVRPEALYVQKGASAEEDGVSAELELDYLEFPVLLVARIPTSGSVRPTLFAGPVLSFETSCEVEGSDGTIEVGGDCETFDTEDPILTKSADFGLAFGAGLEIDTGRLLWLVDGRYTVGLSDINDIESAPESFKNRTWSFLAGVGIKVG